MAFVLTKPGSGSDAAGMRTTAVRTESGRRLNGEETSITAIPYAQAAIVFATDGGSAGARGVSAFLVELDTPGVSIAPH